MIRSDHFIYFFTGECYGSGFTAGMIGGASVINGHMEICDKVTVTGMGMVMRPITEPGVYSSGIPLQPNKVWRKTAALVMNIDDMSKRLKSLERKVNQQD